MKKILRYLIFIVIGGFFVYMAFRNVDPMKLWADVKSANFMWIGLAWLAGMISNLSRAIRWVIITEPLNYKPRLSSSFHGVMISYLVNFAIPRGGEITRAAVLSKTERMPLTTVIGSVVAERVMDVVFMGLIILLAFAVQFDVISGFFNSSAEGADADEGKSPLIWIALAVLFVLGAVFLVVRNKFNHIPFFKKVNELFNGFIEGIKGLTKIKKPWAFLFHSVIIWLMYYLMVYFCFFSIPQTSMLGAAAGLTVLVTSTLAVILPSPGGIGTFHFFVPIGLALYGIDPVDGLTYATIAHAAQMLMFILFGTVSLVAMIILQRKELSK